MEKGGGTGEISARLSLMKVILIIKSMQVNERRRQVNSTGVAAFPTVTGICLEKHTCAGLFISPPVL